MYVNSGEQFVVKSAVGSSPISAAGTYSAVYQKQFLVSFSASGLDSDAGSLTVLAIGSNNYAWNNLPSSVWVDSGSYTWANPVVVSGGEKYTLTSGSASGTIAVGTFSVTYQKQVLVSFSATGLDGDA